MEKMGHGIYIPMDLSLLPPLYLIYAANPSDSGKVSVMECLYLCYYYVCSLCLPFTIVLLHLIFH
jgi:hypothetical protein